MRAEAEASAGPGSEASRTASTATLAVVVIGRDEGERLARCLRSVVPMRVPIVYVDSGSTDGSVERAAALGADVVHLDESIPFTAARARNEGLRRVLDARPETRLVQFVDGDCELDPAWLHTARGALDERPEWAAVTGRLRERDRERSLYTRLADVEWDGAVGDVAHCGGIAMYRVSALQDVGGFDESMSAGEEPELCFRLRRAGWTVHRLAVEMATHDIDMTTLRQWWRRTARSGFAYAEGAARHGAAPHRFCVREVLSICVWGGLVPLAALGLAWWTRGLALVLLAGFPWIAWRVRRSLLRRGASAGDATAYGVACALGKMAQLQGVLRSWLRRVLPGRARPASRAP